MPLNKKNMFSIITFEILDKIEIRVDFWKEEQKIHINENNHNIYSFI